MVLRLARDLARRVKRGQPWIYTESLRETPRAPAGSRAVLLDYKNGRELARGYYDPQGPIAFRACTLDPDQKLDDRWARRRIDQAMGYRRRLFDAETTGYRMLHGEGDGLPGLVVDRYADVAVLKLDGSAATGFYDAQGIADWLVQIAGIKTVVQRDRDRGSEPRVLHGMLSSPEVEFQEHGLKFRADVLTGQKTGFFLDQRENRHLVRRVARGRNVLNLFSYTGGFSIAAGSGGAEHVTSVDVAGAAIETAIQNWRLNDLDPERHTGVCEDVFDYLTSAQAGRRRWDLIVVDPPSFAPNKESLSRAIGAYQRLFAQAAEVVSPGGLLALASCSSHLHEEAFLELCEESISVARRRARLLNVSGPPPDHPSPLAFREFRYLKFALLELDGF